MFRRSCAARAEYISSPSNDGDRFFHFRLAAAMRRKNVSSPRASLAQGLPPVRLSRCAMSTALLFDAYRDVGRAHFVVTSIAIFPVWHP
jgi:hypothetical protein